MKLTFAKLLLGATALAAFAQSPPTHLDVLSVQVLSPTVDGNKPNVDITLQNRGNKPVVAYTLSVTFYNASGKAVASPLVFTADAVFMLRLPGHPNVIEPSQQFVVHTGAQAGVTITSAAATVTSVVYADDTAAGDPTQTAMTFNNRLTGAANAEAAADLLATYPTTAMEAQTRLAKLTQNPRHVPEVDKLSGQSGSLPSQNNWQKAAAEQKAAADFLRSHSQEAKQ